MTFCFVLLFCNLAKKKKSPAEQKLTNANVPSVMIHFAFYGTESTIVDHMYRLIIYLLSQSDNSSNVI